MNWIRIGKSLILAAVFSIGSALSSMAYFDYNQAADEVTMEPMTAYTVYLAMPKTDFGGNFSILPDWKYYKGQGDSEKAEREYTRDGVYMLEGLEIKAPVKSWGQRVVEFDNYFKTNDKKIARSMYQRMLQTLWAGMDEPVVQKEDYAQWSQDNFAMALQLSYDKTAGQYLILLRRYNTDYVSA